ncbi:MAG: tRNA lysidine(34) synthetase TilS [Jatrophihabitans sp.]
MGPHPAVAELRSAVRALLPDRGTVLVACSGGADSVALAAATAFEVCRSGMAAGLVTVDHALQAGSVDRAVAVASLGYELGFDPVEIVPVDVTGDGGPESAARTARYAALDAVAEALDALVLLGHTLDDQAETVLLGLGRGSGPRSIAGMRPRAGRYLRPLLGVRRATTEAACAALDLPVWIDPHNADPRFTRARLRHEVLPLLDDVLGGGVGPALARTADQLREDATALDEIAERFGAESGLTAGDEFEITLLIEQPRAIRVRVLRRWARAAGAGPLTAAHLGGLDRLLADWHGQGPVPLPGGCSVTRSSGRLQMHRT